jgi:alpha-D-ribose 1-methylphosphonate 5-triphosphate diphosphatase PhnM
MIDLLIVAGLTPSGPHGTAAPSDVAVADGQIVAIEPELPRTGARRVVDAGGAYVLPGLVDPHVHVSGRFGSPVGFGMLVRAGVTAALDLAGDVTDLRRNLPTAGCGLTVGVLHALIPGETVPGEAPSEGVLGRFVDDQLERGAFGVKILGGHYPLTPEATATTIDLCARRQAYCAIHAGTTATGSDVEGLEELVELAHGKPAHVAHINSYCRGQVDDPTAEAARALAALSAASAAWSDSYLSRVNGADGLCEDGMPASRVVRTCLRLGGYAETQVALEQAIADGWAQVQLAGADEVGFADAQTGLQLFRQSTEVGISFPVNPAASLLALAVARDGTGAFVVDAFGSDGGSIPRNTTLQQGLALVHGGFLGLGELVQKAATEPARRLGLTAKGRLEVGADADLIVTGPGGRCRHTFIGGQQIVQDGLVVERGGGTVLSPD